MGSHALRIAFLAMLLLLAVSSVSAVAIGVNKARIEFEDVLREGYAEDSFVVSTDSQTPVGGIIEVEGDIVDWVTFRPENVTTTGFSFSANSPKRITVVIQPPADAANGDYEGAIRVLTGELARSEGGLIGTSTRAAIKIAALIGITGVEKRACVIGGFRIPNTEVDQPIDLFYAIKNTGNVRVQPELEVTILDQYEENVVMRNTIVTESEILPTTSAEFLTQVEQELPPGQYWASVRSEDCTGIGGVTFDILERGGVVDRGELVRIDAEPWNEVGDIIPITAIFRNLGSRTVSAKFKGTIMKGQKLVKVIDTDFYNTPPGETADIETFFNPTEPGQFEVKGRVLYNNKLTYEKSAIINVNGEPISGTSAFSIVSIVLILLIILLLLLIIRKRRRRRY